MGFKRYQLQIIFRIALIVLNCFAIAYVIQMRGYWVALANLLAALALQIYLLYRYLTKWREDLLVFSNAVRNNDFTLGYYLSKPGDVLYELHELLNYVASYMRKVKSEYVQQDQYFQYVVQNTPVGLFAYTEGGKIVLFNKEAGKIWGVTRPSHLNELKAAAELYEFVSKLSLLHPVVFNSTHDTSLRISTRLSKIIIDEEPLYLISMINIRSELEANELQSWQDLISVLTHEIMNSITPINSLTGSLDKYLNRIEGNADVVGKARESLAVIQRRSQSLMDFVHRYRSISTVPLPRLEEFDMTELLQSIVTLLENELRAVRIDMPANRYSLIADRALIEQVMINLFKNAASALATASQKAISITVITAPEGMMVIFRDSGTGIPPEILDKIFIPFFTTRKSGSGIGLTISRQIMQRHGGRIEVVSSPGHGTEFRLVFPQRLFH